VRLHSAPPYLWFSGVGVPRTPYIIRGGSSGVPGRVAPGDCSPGAPTDPYVPSRAYGSSGHVLATIRREPLRVDMSTGSDAPALFSRQRCHDQASPSLHGIPRMVPPLRRYYGTLRLPAVRLDPLRIIHEPIPPSRPWFAPLGRGRLTGGQGVVGSGLPIRKSRWKRRGLSGSLETLAVIVRVLRPRQDRAVCMDHGLAT